MRVFVVLFFISSLTYAQSSRPLTSQSRTQTAKITSVLKEKEVDAYLTDLFEDNPEFREIKSKCANTSQTVEEKNNCIASGFQKQLDDIPDDKLVEISKKLNLKNFGVIEREKAKDVKDFLGDRLNVSLFGEDYANKKPNKEMKTFKDSRYVAHGTFYDLFGSQMNKQMLVELSAYCLESFKYVPVDEVDDAKKQCASVSGELKCFKEVAYDPTRASEIEQKIKNDLAQPNQEKIKADYEFCVASGIKLVCDYYQEKNKDKLNQNLQAAIQDNTTNIEGSRACSLMHRMRSFRKAGVALNQTRKELQAIGSDGVGFSATTFYKDAYDGKTHGDKISDITNIASVDVAKSYSDIKEKSQDFENDCIEGTEQACNDYYDDQEYKYLQNAKLEHNAATIVQAKAIENMKDEELEKFSESEGYQNQLNDCRSQFQDSEEVRKCVSDIFKAERMAVIKQIEKRITNVTPTDEELKNTPSLSQKVHKRQEYFADEGERVKRIYQYNNVVSSYLSMEAEGPNQERIELGSNKDALLAEIEAVGDAQYFEQAQKYHEQQARKPGADDSASFSDSCINISFIDQILGGITASDSDQSGCSSK